MALETSDVRIESRWNCQRYTGATRTMTGSASNPAHYYVARMVELHVEAL
jgi:hypothetical protein